MKHRTFLCIIVLALAIPSAAIAAPSSEAPTQSLSAKSSSQCYLSPESEHSFNCDEVDDIKAEVDKAVEEKKDDDNEEFLWIAIFVLLFIILCC